MTVRLSLVWMLISPFNTSMLCVDTSFLELIFSPYGEDAHLFIVHHISLRSVCLQRRNQPFCKCIFFHLVSRCCICASKIQT